MSKDEYVFVCKHCGDELGLKWDADVIGQVTLNQRKPLSAFDIGVIGENLADLGGDIGAHKWLEFARAIEAAHGIGVKDETQKQENRTDE